MKIGLIQSKHNAMYNFLDNNFSFTKAECVQMQSESVEQVLRLLSKAVGGGYDLLVTTECINYIRTSNKNTAEDRWFYPPLECNEVNRLSLAAKAADAWLVAGFAYAAEETAYNAALIFDRNGSLIHTYKKMYLAGDEKNVFTAGDKFAVINADFAHLGICICWDLQQPEVARQLALLGADIVVCPTWGYEQNLYGRARAYENGIHLATAMSVPAWGNIDGERTPSSVVDPSGNVLCCGSRDSPQLVECNLTLSASKPMREMRLNCRRPELYKEGRQ